MSHFSNRSSPCQLQGPCSTRRVWGTSRLTLCFGQRAQVQRLVLESLASPHPLILAPASSLPCPGGAVSGLCDLGETPGQPQAAQAPGLLLLTLWAFKSIPFPHSLSPTAQECHLLP